MLILLATRRSDGSDHHGSTGQFTSSAPSTLNITTTAIIQKSAKLTTFQSTHSVFPSTQKLSPTFHSTKMPSTSTQQATKQVMGEATTSLLSSNKLASPGVKFLTNRMREIENPTSQKETMATKSMQGTTTPIGMINTEHRLYQTKNDVKAAVTTSTGFDSVTGNNSTDRIGWKNADGENVELGEWWFGLQSATINKNGLFHFTGSLHFISRKTREWNRIFH